MHAAMHESYVETHISIQGYGLNSFMHAAIHESYDICLAYVCPVSCMKICFTHDTYGCMMAAANIGSKRISFIGYTCFMHAAIYETYVRTHITIHEYVEKACRNAWNICLVYKWYASCMKHILHAWHIWLHDGRFQT